jgi:hypothetical protein
MPSCRKHGHVGVSPRTNSKLWIGVHVTIFEPLSPSIVTPSFKVKIFSSFLAISINDVLRNSLTKVTNIYQFDTERKRTKYIFITWLSWNPLDYKKTLKGNLKKRFSPPFRSTYAFN